MHDHDWRCWGYMHSSYQGGGDLLCGACLHPTTITWGTYAVNGEGSYWGGREGLPVFSNCLQSSASEACWVLMCPLQLLMGNMSLAALLAIPPSHPLPEKLSLKLPVQLHWHPPHPIGNAIYLGRRLQNQLPLKSLLIKSEERGSFSWSSKENCQEVFCWDSDLVQITRWRYFEAHCPTFDQEGFHDLSGLFWEMVTCANLLDSEIYKIQEVCTGWRDL